MHIDSMVLDISARVMLSRALTVEPEPSLPNGNQELGTAWRLPADQFKGMNENNNLARAFRRKRERNRRSEVMNRKEVEGGANKT